MKIRNYITLSLLACFLGAAIVITILGVKYVALEEERARVLHALEERDALIQLETVLGSWLLLNDMIIANDQIFLGDKSRDQGKQLIDLLGVIKVVSQEKKEELEGAIRQILQYINEVDGEDEVPHQRMNEILDSYDAISKRVVVSLDSFVKSFQEAQESAMSRSEESIAQYKILVRNLLIAYIIFLIFVVFVCVKKIVRPIEHLSKLCRTEGASLSTFHSAAAPREIKALAQALDDALEELKEESATNQAIFDNARNGVFLLNEAGEILKWNRSGSRILHFGDEDLCGKNLLDYLQDAEGKNSSEALSMDLFEISGAKGGTVKVHGRCPDGKILPLALSAGAFQVSDGKEYVVILSDLSHVDELERQLQQAQRLESVGQLAAGLAHEINTPIQFVRDNAKFIHQESERLKQFAELLLPLLEKQELLQQDLTLLKTKAEEIELDYLSEEIPTAAKETIEGAEKVGDIVKSMKLFSHPGGEDKVTGDINSIIESSVTVSTNEWRFVADVELELDPELPQVACHPGKLGQAFLNIIVNAAHAIGDQIEAEEGEKGKIILKTSHESGMILATFSDTGGGIPESIQGKIFDPFFTTKDPDKGTGQGLALAFSTIVDQHQGQLSFESEEGKGTTFRVALPLA